MYCVFGCGVEILPWQFSINQLRMLQIKEKYHFHCLLALEYFGKRVKGEEKFVDGC